MRRQCLFRYMAYLLNLPHLAAHLLAISQVQHAPDEQRQEFVFDGPEVGAQENEDVIVTVERRRKASTLLFHTADYTIGMDYG